MRISDWSSEVCSSDLGMLNTRELEQHEVVNIACSEQTTLNSLWDLIEDIAGKKIKPKYSVERKGDVKHSLADIGKAKCIFSYTPIYGIEEGLKSTFLF